MLQSFWRRDGSRLCGSFLYASSSRGRREASATVRSMQADQKRGDRICVTHSGGAEENPDSPPLPALLALIIRSLSPSLLTLLRYKKKFFVCGIPFGTVLTEWS